MSGHARNHFGSASMRRAWELCLFAVAFTSAVAPGVIRRLNDAAAEAADPNAAVAVAVDSGEAAVARTQLQLALALSTHALGHWFGLCSKTGRKAW